MKVGKDAPGIRNIMQRFFDIVFSLIGLIISSPIFLIMAIVIAIDSPGGVFYKGERIGKDGKPFKMYKFRSMVPNAAQIGAVNVMDNDNRVTRVGHFLRKSKIDELPQFINVLKGDMSFVGPRPEVQCFVDMYTEEEEVILTMRPGITDWASMANFKQYEILGELGDKINPDDVYVKLIRPLKLKLQLYHVEHNSLGSYFKIIFWTVYKVVSRSEKLPKEIEPMVEQYAKEILVVKEELLKA